MTAVHADADRTLLTAVPAPPLEITDDRLNAFEVAFNYTLDALPRLVFLAMLACFTAAVMVAVLVLAGSAVTAAYALIWAGRTVAFAMRPDQSRPAVRTARRPVTPRRWSW